MGCVSGWFGDTRGMRRLLPALALLAACSDSGSEPALSSATSLQCPSPGALPFRLSSKGFQKSANKTLATDNPRNKDEASDTLGNPNGVVASVFLGDDQRASAAPVDYHGTKARTTPTGGLFSTPLPGENVSLWSYDPDKAAWQSVGQGKTDDNGAYDLPATGFVAPNGRPIYSVLEADGSCAVHSDYLFAPGTKVVVTDIDGTLTTNDNEITLQIADDTHVPAMMTAADRLMQAWSMKGYPIIYLTARPHVLRAESRGWLADLTFPDGPLIMKLAALRDDVHKTLWLNRMIQDFGWSVVAAYGNADTDITAYENVGIPKDHTFIIGPLGGTSGTVAIPNSDYTQHIATYVSAQPANQ
jgi:LNS2 (Lipin/Ned1/Smp2)